MAKTLKFAYQGKKYTLEFTRATVKDMEGDGFRITSVDEMPMTMLPMLYQGAFRAHHGDTKAALADEIYSKLPNKEKLLQKLAEMYRETLETLMAEPEDSQENVTWMADW